MNKPQWLILKKKHLIGLTVLVILALGTMVLLNWGGFNGRVQMAPEQLLAEALQKSLQSSSYRFEVDVKPGGRETFIHAQGERVAPNKVKVKGQIQKTAVEYIQISDKLYMRDSFSNRWLAVNGSTMAQSELFMMEFNPLALFNFKDVPEIRLREKEKVEGKTYLVVECSPNIQNPYLEMKYSDFECKLWIDPSSRRISRANMLAKTLANERDMISINLKFWDYDKDIVIEAPQV